MKYWDAETPTVVETEKNVLSWYPEAGRLHVAKPCWYDKDGNMKVGKTVSLDVNALKSGDDKEETIQIFKEIFDRLTID